MDVGWYQGAPLCLTIRLLGIVLAGLSSFEQKRGVL